MVGSSLLHLLNQLKGLRAAMRGQSALNNVKLVVKSCLRQLESTQQFTAFAGNQRHGTRSCRTIALEQRVDHELVSGIDEGITNPKSAPQFMITDHGLQMTCG